MANPFDQFDNTNGTATAAPANLFDQFDPASTPGTTSAAGAFTRGAATAVAPSFGALAGAKAGAKIGLKVGALIPGLGETGVGEIGGTIIGGIIGSLIGDKVQGEAIKTAAPETYDQLQKLQQEDLAQHPVAAAAGGLAGSIPAFHFGSPVQAAKGAVALSKVARGTKWADLTEQEQQLAKNLGTQIAVGTGAGIIAPVVQGQKPTVGEISQSVAQALLFGEPRFGGKAAITKPTTESEEANASKESSTAGVSGTQVRPPVGEETPLRQQGETAVPRQEDETAHGQSPSGGSGGTQSDVRVTPAPPPADPTPEQITKPENRFSKASRPSLSVDYFHAAGEATKDPEWWVNLFRKTARDNIDPQDTTYQAGLYLRQLGDEKAAPVVDALAKARQRMSEIKTTAIRAVDEAKTPDEKLAALGNPDFRLAGMTQYPREAVETAYDRGSSMGTVPREKAAPLKMPKQMKTELQQALPEVFGVPEGEQHSIGAARAGSPEFSGASPDIMGVRQRTRIEMLRAGHPVTAEPGEGVNLDEALNNGRALLQENPNMPDEVAAEFGKTKRFSYNDFSAVRAKYERAMAEAQLVRWKFGDNSPEAEAARQEAMKWSKLTKDMQTEWSKLGVAQQGVTDIDTGDPVSLETNFKDATGKDFTPKQRTEAEQKTKVVRDQQEKVEVASGELNKDLAKKAQPIDVQKKETQKALDAVHQQHRENAIRIAQAEIDSRVAAQELKNAEQNVQPAAAKKALESAGKVTRRQAAETARKENAARVAAAKQKVQVARIQEREAKKAQQATVDVRRRLAAELAKLEAYTRAHPEVKVWDEVRNNLESGETNFDTIRNNIASKLGMKLSDVNRLITKSSQTKSLSDDLWKKQQDLRRFRQQAKDWLREQGTPGYLRALSKIPKVLFGMKVGFHGTVALGTHAPAVAFQPQFWGVYLRNFARMYKMVGSPAYYEMQMQDLVRRNGKTPSGKDFNIWQYARRMGLVNDPFQFEDYNDPNATLYAKLWNAPGQRGYAVLKTLRQDMFEQHWNSLPRTAQTDEVAKQISDAINHATGVIKARIPGAALALFAPRLEASRVAWLVADPAKAANTFLNWKNATEAEKQFAIYQAKEKGAVMAAMASLLALNQAMLSMAGSNQKINFDDPMKSDWLKFKVAGMDFAYGNAMTTMVRFPMRLWQIRESSGGQLKNLIYPDEDSYTATGEYVRSQLSPFASLASTLWFKSDWQNRPLPNSNRPVPKRLAAQGVRPYTWTEFAAEQVAPIPFEEALRDTWQMMFGPDKVQMSRLLKGMATVSVMMGTGARLTDDVQGGGGKYIWTPKDFGPPTTTGQTSVMGE